MDSPTVTLSPLSRFLRKVVGIVGFIFQVLVIEGEAFGGGGGFEAPVAEVEVIIRDLVGIVPGAFFAAFVPAAEVL